MDELDKSWCSFTIFTIFVCTWTPVSLTFLYLSLSLSVPVCVSQTLTVLVKNGVEVQPCPVKVLDTDTITQVGNCLSVSLSICLPAHPPVCLPACLSVCLSVSHLSFCVQVKDKILDQVYRGAPFSQRPAADSLDLGTNTHLPVSLVWFD